MHFLIPILLLVGCGSSHPESIEDPKANEFRRGARTDNFEGGVNEGMWTHILVKGTPFQPPSLNEALEFAKGVRLVSEPTRNGRGAIELTVFPGDQVADTDESNGNERCELMRKVDFEAVNGDKRTYGLSFLLPPDFPPYPRDRFIILTQWLKNREGSDGGYPNPTISLILKSDGSRHWLQLYHRNSSAPAQIWQLDEVQRGQWTDIALEINWNEDPNQGYFRLYRNDRLLVEKVSRTSIPGNSGHHFKIGQYRNQMNLTTSILYDAIWIE